MSQEKQRKLQSEDCFMDCDVCCDLIPLVRDDVASDSSRELVLTHMSSCDECRGVYDSCSREEARSAEEERISDRKIMGKIRRSLYLTSCFFLVICMVAGVGITHSSGMFYNMVLMPLAGFCSYFVLRDKHYLASAAVFVLAYVWQAVLMMISWFTQPHMAGVSFLECLSEIFVSPLLLCILYFVMMELGAAIGCLIRYALRGPDLRNEHKVEMEFQHNDRKWRDGNEVHREE